MDNLVKKVSKSLGISKREAEKIVNEQAEIGKQLLADGDLSISDVDDLMYDMGIEPDDMEEFLLCMM